MAVLSRLPEASFEPSEDGGQAPEPLPTRKLIRAEPRTEAEVAEHPSIQAVTEEIVLTAMEVAEAAREFGVVSYLSSVTHPGLEEIAQAKWPDLTAADMDAAVRTIAGSARSMGLDVEGVK